jgi:UDPglucose 6-dehydrogenase
MIIGIIGNGFVGKATFQLKCKDIDILAYDIDPAACVPEGLSIDRMNECEIIFVSVPTPMSKNGSCHLNIIHSVLNDLKKINYNGQVILRSTVPVGTSDSLNVCFMPEFLTEKNFINDFITNPEWIFGLLDTPESGIVKKKLTTLFDLAHENGKIDSNNLHFLTNKEAEMIKMFRNCFLATKVSFCNEVAQFCEKKGVDYSVVRNLATIDKRIGGGHSAVPGHDGKKGYGGTCFPKDTSSLRYEMSQSGMNPYVMNAIIERNDNVDRPEQDWLLDKGRAAVDE